jgi:predicted phage terminase large subunit-like protein
MDKVRLSAMKCLTSCDEWPESETVEVVKRDESPVPSAILQDHQRRSLIEFTKSTHEDYLEGWANQKVCKLLEQFSKDVAAKKSPRLILTMPPRTGKSMLASERFPVFHLSKYPKHEIVIAGYAIKPARDRTTEARRVALSDSVQALMGEALELRDDTHAKGDWRLEAGGGVLAVGVQGSLTGSGADILIIDDPVKDWLDAYSPGKRQAVWDWYQSTAYTRLAPGGGVLLILTRWHEDDLAGRLLAQQATADAKDDEEERPRWIIHNFEALASEDEEHRKQGEALHPERFDRAALLEKKINIGPTKWQALYMGGPVTPGGSVWRREWFKYWTQKALKEPQILDGWRVRPKEFDRIILSWDLTFGSQSKTASYVVGQVWARLGKDIFLLEEVRGRWGFVESSKHIISMAARYPQGISAIENKANGPAIIDALKKKLRRLRAIEPDGSKLARAHAASVPIEVGRVFLPDLASHPWVAHWLDEVCAFPMGPNDDRTDAASQAIRMLDKESASLVFGRRK